MYFVYGCPKVLSLRPEPKPGEQILEVAFNPSGSLLAVASTSRLCLWSGGKDHVPLGVLTLPLRGLAGTSLLWKRDSGLLGMVSSAGKLVLVSVKRRAGARPASERFALPDWIEPQHARTAADNDGEERDAWADPAEADLTVVSTVESIGSEASAVCLGRFGQHVLLGTASGSIYGVSWEGQILCCYDIVAGPSPSPRVSISSGGSGGHLGQSETEPVSRRFGGQGASSMSFNDTLQLLALTATDGSFFLGTLSKTTCWLRNIAVADRSRATAAAPPSHAAAGRKPNPATPPSYLANADSDNQARGWGWRLLGTGRNAVAAAVDALSSPRSNTDGVFFSGGDGGDGGDGGGGEQSSAAAGDSESGDTGGTGAMGVEFSAKGGLMAVALADGTVLLARVERYTSGVRARHKLQISNSMLHRSDSHRLEDYLADETLRAEQGLGDVSEGDGKGGVTSPPDARTRTFSREETMSSLWGVEVHHLNCLSLDPWLGPGDGGGGSLVGPAGRVLSLCFSADGGALAVGHEGALTVWSTEDGTRLVCTTTESRDDLDGGYDGNNGGMPAADGDGGGGGSGGEGHGESSSEPPLSPSSRAARGTLDIIAGGARALSWEREGYRLMSVGSAIGAAGEGGGGGGQGIVAFDFLRRARSNLSSSLLSLQGSDRIALVDSQPWSAQVLLWRVLPVHPGYLSSNAPLRHVSTSRAGTYVAVAGSRGFAVYSRPTNRWRLFGNIEQEREVQVAGMCWWGESALVVASRLKHGFILLLFSRKHLSSDALMIPPIRLPVGMRPLFMQAVQEGGSRPGTDVLFLLVAGSTSYLLYRLSCTGGVFEAGNVTYSVLHEGPLPHVLGNMEPDHHDADPSPSDPSPPEQSPTEQSSTAEDTAAATSASRGAAAPTAGGGPGGSGSSNTGGSRAGGGVVNGGFAVGGWGQGAKRETRRGGDLPEIGPPKRVMLLPEVHPRSIALLDFDGNLVTMEMSSGVVSRVAEGVESVVDLTGVSEAWEVWEMPLLVHPCYLLRRKGRVGGGGRRWGQRPGENDYDDDGSEGGTEEFSVWCPAMRLDPCPPSVQRLLTPGRATGSGGGDEMTPSPVFSLDPGASCDPERVDLGLQPLLGTMVHASQVVCRPRISNTPPLPPCYEVRTHLRPILHMVLRHLLIASQLQLLDSPPPLPPLPPPQAAPAPVSPRARAPHPFVLPPVAQRQGEEEDRRHAAAAARGEDGAAGVAGVAASSGEGGYDGDTERGSSSPGGGRRNGPAAAAAAGGSGPGEEGEGGGGSGQREQRDWHGTSSDAFEIAVAVLKRCREDSVLVEALPDTLELLLRACMEGLSIAGARAKRSSLSSSSSSNGGSDSGGHPRRLDVGGAATAVVSELELARAVMSDSVYLAQLAPECFHEVVARVARKAEPERYPLLFPLHLVCGAPDAEEEETATAFSGSGSGGSSGGGRAPSVHPVNGERAGAGAGGVGRVGGCVGPRWGRWLHPTHLFHECVSSGKLTTAAWYLPLIRDDVAYDAAQRHVGPQGPLSEEERSRLMPLEMWAVTGKGWPYGLSHALSCVLLLASLSSNQHAFLPEVWLFARKREQSAPHHHHHHHHHHHQNDSRHRHRRSSSTAAQPVAAGVESGVPDARWWAMGQGAAIEALRTGDEARRQAGGGGGGGGGAEAMLRRTSSDNRFRRGSLGWAGGAGWGSSAGGEMKRVPRSPVPRAALEGGEGTHFGRTSALRLRALRRPGRLGDTDADSADDAENVPLPSPNESGEEEPRERRESPPTLPPQQRPEVEGTRLYHLPLTRDAASVVSRFMWKELNDLRVKVVLRAFQSLACSAAAREAGLGAGEVLSALSPARRSMVGSLHGSPVETMAGLLVSLAEMFKVSVGTLAQLAAPAGQQQQQQQQQQSETPPRADGSSAVLPPGTPSVTEIPGSSSAPNSTSSGREGGGGGGGGGGPTSAARLRALSALSASVRPQLELLGDLSRAVGHAEAALVSASLLRDMAAATAILGSASQPLRVGYGHFIANLLEQIKVARAAAAATRAPPKPADNRATAEREEGAGKNPPGSSERLNGGSGGVPAAAAPVSGGAAAGAMALIGLQRFGGKCVRALAEGAAYA